MAARGGDAALLGEALGAGLPPDLRNDRGDTLLMLASYHGQADAVRAAEVLEAERSGIAGRLAAA